MTGLAIAVIAAIPGLLGAWLAYKQATRANSQSMTAEIRRVDAEAYERAQGIWEAGYSQLERQIGLLSEQLTKEQSSSALLRLRLAQVEATLALFRRHMIDAGIAVPTLPEQAGA